MSSKQTSKAANPNESKNDSISDKAKMLDMDAVVKISKDTNETGLTIVSADVSQMVGQPEGTPSNDILKDVSLPNKREMKKGERPTFEFKGTEWPSNLFEFIKRYGEYFLIHWVPHDFCIRPMLAIIYHEVSEMQEKWKLETPLPKLPEMISLRIQPKLYVDVADLNKKFLDSIQTQLEVMIKNENNGSVPKEIINFDKTRLGIFSDVDPMSRVGQILKTYKDTLSQLKALGIKETSIPIPPTLVDYESNCIWKPKCAFISWVKKGSALFQALDNEGLIEKFCLDYYRKFFY